MRQFQTKMKPIALASVALAIALASYALAQIGKPAVPKDPALDIGSGPLHLETVVGSFKLKPRGKAMPTGTMTISFTGTVLISNLVGTIQSSGNLRREYYEKKHEKQVWFGTGTLKLVGKMDNVEWFGRNMKADYVGNGVFQLYGEFDKKLETGYYWYADPKKKEYWGTSGNQVVVPEPINQSVTPIPRGGSNNGKGG